MACYRTLSLLSLADGYCFSSVHADDLPRLNPPHEYKGADSVAGSWEWVTMSVVPYIEVCPQTILLGVPLIMVTSL